MFQNFLLKTMLKKQLKDIPQAEQDKLFAVIEKNPDFFMAVAKEAQVRISSGMSQQEAVMAVLAEKQEELKIVMGT